MFQLNFEKLVSYDSGRSGITIDVCASLKDSSTNFSAKIDTGSEACIFARNIGEEIGIDIESGELQIFGTVTGTFQTYGHFLTLTVNDFSFDSYVFFAESESFNRNVLGRFGWLDRVIIGINDYEGKLYLKTYE